MYEQTQTGFEGYSYRTNSRFGGRVQVSVDGETVSVSGPRVSPFTYGLWFGVQLVLLWLAPLALLAAVLLWNWRYLALALALVVVQGLFGAIGVASFWELANVTAVYGGHDQTASFPLSAVKRVKIGRGWARKGVRFIIPHIIPGIDQMSEGRAVSFEAPDGESGKDCVYAILMWDERNAATLAALLKG